MISYPLSHQEQKQIALGFERQSGVGFAPCAGALDGVIIEAQHILEQSIGGGYHFQVVTCQDQQRIDPTLPRNILATALEASDFVDLQ